MAFKANDAIPVLNEYLGISESDKQYISDTQKRGFILQLKSGERAVIFVYPLVHKQDGAKNYFDTRDSGALKRNVAWKYAQLNKLKYFCFGINNSFDKYADYVFSLECDEETIQILSGTKEGQRSGPGNQIIIPNDYIPTQEFERIQNKSGVFISVIHKNALYDYMEKYDHRPYLNVYSNSILKAADKRTIVIRSFDRNHSEEELGEILADMYNGALEEEKQVAAVHVFGIKYGQEIIDNNYKAKSIILSAGLKESYYYELNKGLNIYKCLNEDRFHVSFDDKLSDLENQTDINEKIRKTGGENILYYGVPGCGKSHEISKICSDINDMERVVFHPDYTYTDFAGQILPRLKGEKLEYIFSPGPFTKILKKAYYNPAKMHYLIIEELNRGNAPAIFGEIFQLLDRDKTGGSEYAISNYDIANEVYKNPDILVRIPSNLTILATMNTADQNVFTLDTAFQRRWCMKHISNNFKGEHACNIIQGTNIAWGAFATVINDIVTDISIDVADSGDKRLGAYFAKKSELTADVFPEKILKYLWDDAFRMDKETVFSDKYKSLDEVIDKYKADPEDKLRSVLQENVYKQMIERTKHYLEE